MKVVVVKVAVRKGNKATRKRKGNLWEAVSFPNANLHCKEIMIIFMGRSSHMGVYAYLNTYIYYY